MFRYLMYLSIFIFFFLYQYIYIYMLYPCKCIHFGKDNTVSNEASKKMIHESWNRGLAHSSY